MSDAVDTPANSNRKGRHERATPLGEKQAEWAKQAREAAAKNPVIDSYYELAMGHKLLLCKKKKSGSVYKVMVGSTLDKEHGVEIKAKVEALQKQNKLRIQV